MVADGRLHMGLTDTDDALGAVRDGAPVELVFLDQEEDGLGTLVVPNTVSLIQGGPNPENGQQLIDYLLSAETEKVLSEIGWFEISLRNNGHMESQLLDGLAAMAVSYEDVYRQLEISSADMREVFLR